MVQVPAAEAWCGAASFFKELSDHGCLSTVPDKVTAWDCFDALEVSMNSLSHLSISGIPELSSEFDLAKEFGLSLSLRAISGSLSARGHA